MPQLALVPSEPDRTKPTAAEFFAGIGLVRMGLQAAGFEVVWSNDIEPDKQAMYAGHFQDTDGRHQFNLGDVAKVTAADLPEDLSLAWASFPCTDLSLAGWRRGLSGEHSGTFFHFTRVLGELGERSPSVIALENVVGLATSHGGDDLTAAISALNDLGYSVDVLTLDARRFVPQSRPRLFLVGAKDAPVNALLPDSQLRPDWLQRPFFDSGLRTHQADLPAPPPLLTAGLTKLADTIPSDSDLWWDDRRREAFLASLSAIQAQRLDVMRKRRSISRRTAYRRTRNGIPVWEIRSDDIAGCLRTARGGSSKQAVVEAGKGEVRVRWMTPREYAKLMGASEYRLDGLRTNQALFGFGDAVCVPAVAWLAEHYLMPLVLGKMPTQASPELDAISA